MKPAIRNFAYHNRREHGNAAEAVVCSGSEDNCMFCKMQGGHILTSKCDERPALAEFAIAPFLIVPPLVVVGRPGCAVG